MKVKWIEASAGCGKTTFLLDSYKLTANKSLFITFSKAAAEELKSRIKDTSVKITTLHSLAYNILKEYRSINQVKNKALQSQALAELLQNANVFSLFEWLNKNSDGEIYKEECSDFELRPETPLIEHNLINKLYETSLLYRQSLDEIKKIFYTKQGVLRKRIIISDCDADTQTLADYTEKSLERFHLHEKKLENYIAKVRNQLYDVVSLKEQALKNQLGIVYYNDLITETNVIIENDGSVIYKHLGDIKNIYIDEVQDLSKDQLTLLLTILKEWESVSEELFIAGDPKQLIYEFQGASIEEFNKFKSQLLPIATIFEEVKLNITHRLPKKICTFINKIGTHLNINYMEHTTNRVSEGEIQALKVNSYDNILSLITSDSMILFKQKHPLVENLAISLIKKGIMLNSPYIIHHPIIRDFCHLIRWISYKNDVSLGVVFNAFGKPDLNREDIYKQPEMQFLHTLKNSDLLQLFVQWIEFQPVLKHMNEKLDLSSKFFINILRNYAEYYRYSPYEAIFDLNGFFDSNSFLFEEGVFLNTIHSSKGRESNRVILLDTDKNSKFKNDTDRLMYVALTRAKEELIIPIFRESCDNTWAEKILANTQLQTFG